MSNGNRYAYDANGNMTVRREKLDGISYVYTQTWTIDNRLASVIKSDVTGTILATTTISYDGDGVRVKKVDPSGATYYLGAVEVLITGTTQVTTSYYAFGGVMVAMRTAATATLTYLHGDHLGSTSLTTNISGTVVSQQRYKPYGEVRWSSGAGLPTDFTFTGQRAGPANYVGSLMDYNARFFSPALGRFISADTIVPGAGNPAAFNRYMYVLGNPLRYVDPSGHMQANPDLGGCGATCNSPATSPSATPYPTAAPTNTPVQAAAPVPQLVRIPTDPNPTSTPYPPGYASPQQFSDETELQRRLENAVMDTLMAFGAETVNGEIEIGPIDIGVWKWEIQASSKTQGTGNALAGVFKNKEFTFPSGQSITYDGRGISTLAGQVRNGPNTVFNKVGAAIGPVGEVQYAQSINSSTTYERNGVSMTQKFSMQTKMTNRGVPISAGLALAWVAKPVVVPILFWLAQRPAMAR